MVVSSLMSIVFLRCYRGVPFAPHAAADAEHKKKRSRHEPLNVFKPHTQLNAKKRYYSCLVRHRSICSFICEPLFIQVQQQLVGTRWTRVVHLVFPLSLISFWFDSTCTFARILWYNIFFFDYFHFFLSLHPILT